MSKKYDVIALGELLIDFTDSGKSDQGNPVFEANPGGAPCNVLAMLKKLGREVAFVGKVGDDIFGTQLRSTVEDCGICTDYLITDKEANTTLAFVKTFEGGDREFSFYRNPGADMMLKEDEIGDYIGDTKVFHFGTLSMTHEGVRAATKKALKIAKENGAIISFDPNLRPPLWKSLDEAKEQISYGLGICDVLKIADNEIRFMTGEEDLVLAAKKLIETYPTIKLVTVTAGADGSYAYCNGLSAYVDSVKLGGTIETTGAGDTFCACLINAALDGVLEDTTEEKLADMLKFANTAAYIVTTKKGAIRSMPDREDIMKILEDK